MFHKFRKMEWHIAYRKKEEKPLFENLNGNKFKVVKNSFRYWYADPFPFEYNGKQYVFCEMYDRLKRKGIIGCSYLKNNKFLKMKKIYECESHLSYPYIFEVNDNIYMIPESKNLGELILLKCINFPYDWKLEKKLMVNESLVDSTFDVIDSRTFMLTTKVIGKDNVANLFLYTLENGEFVEIQKVYECQADKSRNGGRIMHYNGNNIRVSQDCSSGYGTALNFSYFNITENKFSEDFFVKVTKDDIKINKKNNFDGIHTYNMSDKLEFVDLKYNHKLSVVEILGYLLSKIGFFKQKKK